MFQADRFIDETRQFVEVPFMLSIQKMPRNNVFSPNDIQPNIFKSFMGWTWDKLFRREFIVENNITFQEQRIYNDMLFVFSACLKAKKISLLKEVLVHQRKRGGGSLSDSRAAHLECLFSAIIALKEMLIRENLFIRYKREYMNYVLHLIDNNLTSLSETSLYYQKFSDALRTKWFNELEIFEFPRSYYYYNAEYDRCRKVYLKH